MRKAQASQEMIARCFWERGYIEQLANTGARLAPVALDDLTNSQANLIDCCVRDPRMQALAHQVLDLGDLLQDEHGLSGAGLGLAAMEIMGRSFGERGYIHRLAVSGARIIDTHVGDLTNAQANLIDVRSKDERMQRLADQVLDLADVIEVENSLEKARPWYDE